jgi:hypothetical protein
MTVRSSWLIVVSDMASQNPIRRDSKVASNISSNKDEWTHPNIFVARMAFLCHWPRLKNEERAIGINARAVGTMLTQG